MHLDLDDSVTTAGLAPSALDIKTETAFLVALCLGICGGCKNDHGSGQKAPVYVAGLERGVLPIGDWSILITLSS